MALETNELGFEYRGGKAVVDGVSVRFRAGAVTGIVGPNGAGKSTLLRLLLGVLKPTRGRVELDGADVWEMPARRRARRMAYIPQKTSPAFGFTVRECVRMGRLSWGGAADEVVVTAALGKVGLLDRAEEVFDTLSAGQQQKAVLARALAQLSGVESPVVLADEPASALDPAHTLEAMTILRERTGGGGTVVLVVHDLGAAARYCDEVVVLAKGKVAAVGLAGEVLTPGVLDPVFGVRFVREPGALVATAGVGELR